VTEGEKRKSTELEMVAGAPTKAKSESIEVTKVGRHVMDLEKYIKDKDLEEDVQTEL